MGSASWRIATLAGLAVTLASGSVEAVPSATASAVRGLSLLEPAQFIHLGRPYCWYPYGWAGPGWYLCGYGTQAGVGWGGPYGWNGWAVPRSYRTPGYRHRLYR